MATVYMQTLIESARRIRKGSFMPDFRNDMSNERRALAEGPAPEPTTRSIASDFEFRRREGDQPIDAAYGVVLATVANLALRVGRGIAPMKNLAEMLERFGVRRKA